MMAKAYVCDACSVTMENPYRENMREFYIGVDYADGLPVRTKRKVKVHLCEECYHALHVIAKRSVNDGNL